MISDEELMRQIKYGEKNALDTLVRRYHGPIHAYIVRMGLEYHLANDIVQEVFIKLIRNIKCYETARPFRPWLYTIASNTYKDYFKKAYVQKDVPSSEIPETTLANADSPEGLFIKQEGRENVTAALQLLSEIHREVLVLRYYQDLKLDEIALILAIPLGTVKSRLHSALHNLKKLLTEGAILNDDKVG
ncbi:MAG: RNA polymerase sigma factor [Pelosinus sp.]|nr:RNA polymerase sigma factor [Pelosinus sp.]